MPAWLIAIGVIGALIIIGLAIYYLLRGAPASEPPAPPSSVSGRARLEPTFIEEFAERLETVKAKLSYPLEPPAAEPPQDQAGAPPAGAVLPPQPATSGVGAKSLAERYPPSYVEDLREFQDRLIRDGVIPESERLALANEAEITAFLRKALDYLLARELERPETGQAFAGARLTQDPNSGVLEYQGTPGRISPKFPREFYELAPGRITADGQWTEEELFHTLYPDFYLDELAFLQDLMVSGGILKPEERAALENTAEVEALTLRMVGYLASQELISGREEKNFRYGITQVLPGLQEFEIKQVQSKRQAAAEPGSDVAYRVDSSGAFEAPGSRGGNLFALGYAGKLVSGALAFLGPVLEQFGISAAYGAVVDGGGAGGVSLPVEFGYCYRGIGIALPLGYNFWTECCSCCEPCGKACCPVGCLDLCGGNAIWDPTSGLCGCG
ncbi:MAG: hypothetical protein A3B37_01380 [Candidatus Sungbacteria bacterium RIFCSPLOWO2_01_FULL_59_16]|uniref:Uncharacterized protein n=1 Tax=Candidatus Sungbacteria bacterium RIFCSPLOWO2_01_FULL_59_16 TaxID=1802280 RepID=A0A1G2LC07_9BACT|nr:MAG: hypothetical protein A3B37_01380 [Candidatus Sungbacteria bacterium RIFCSPLOWO2_01_FULL_59_16]